MKQICDSIGLNYKNGIMYKLKPFLIRYEILKPKGVFVYRDLPRIEYGINTKELNRFFMTETFMKPLYDRIWNGDFITLTKLKSKEWQYGT